MKRTVKTDFRPEKRCRRGGRLPTPTPAPTPTPPPAADREANGRFAPGCPGGPGRKPIPTEATYLKTLRDAVSAEDWHQVCDRALDDAKGGDHAARCWLAHYLLGPEPLSLTELAAEEVSDPNGTAHLRDAVVRVLSLACLQTPHPDIADAADDLVEAALSGRDVTDIMLERIEARRHDNDDGDADPNPNPTPKE